MLENTIHSIVGLARAEKALFTVTGISLGPFLHIDPLEVCRAELEVSGDYQKGWFYVSQKNHPMIHTERGGCMQGYITPKGYWQPNYFTLICIESMVTLSALPAKFLANFCAAWREDGRHRQLEAES